MSSATAVGRKQPRTGLTGRIASEQGGLRLPYALFPASMRLSNLEANQAQLLSDNWRVDGVTATISCTYFSFNGAATDKTNSTGKIIINNNQIFLSNHRAANN